MLASVSTLCRKLLCFCAHSRDVGLDVVFFTQLFELRVDALGLRLLARLVSPSALRLAMPSRLRPFRLAMPFLEGTRVTCRCHFVTKRATS